MSRNKAQQLILSGCIFVNGKCIKKPAYEINETDHIEIKKSIEYEYVGRGGLKLEGALYEFKISPAKLTAVDIGSSTGGFTECLLRYGAEKVYAFDSGKEQMHESLKHDPRIILREGFNARYLKIEDIGGEKAGIITVDVSFISQSLLYGAISELLDENAPLITLIKPQFEVGKEFVGKNGIIRDKKLHCDAIMTLVQKAALYGFGCVSLMNSPIKGGDGNTEYLALFYKNKKSIDLSYINQIVK